MAETDRSGAPSVPPEVPAELADVYRLAYLAAYAESVERPLSDDDLLDDESQDEGIEDLDDRHDSDVADGGSAPDSTTDRAGFAERVRTNLASTPVREPRSASSAPTHQPESESAGAWARFRLSPWFIPLVWLIVFLLLVVLAYVAGRNLASSLS